MSREEATVVTVAGQQVRVSHPDKVLFPTQGWTKRDLVDHYLRCAPGAVRAVEGRPCNLKRWPDGVTGKPFYLRRTKPSDEVETVTVRFASARPGPMWVPRTEADLVRMVQLNCIDLNPWPVRADDIDHPDELRIDLDPTPGIAFDAVRRVAAVVRDVLAEDGLVGFPKTSGSRGIHVYVRIAPRWTFHQVRRAVLAIAREVTRRTDEATTAWWKEERHGVFLDFNQMARDKTIASAYSVRPTGLVSTPFAWDELFVLDPAAMTLDGFARRWEEVGDLHAPLDGTAHDLSPALERVAADEERGLGDAPWPPHYPKQPGEPPRVAPSRARTQEPPTPDR